MLWPHHCTVKKATALNSIIGRVFHLCYNGVEVLLHTDCLPVFWLLFQFLGYYWCWCPSALHTHTHACTHARTHARTHTHTHTRLTALYPGLPRWASTRKVKPIWILLKQETVGGSSISWAIMQVCTSLQTDNHTSTPPLLCFLQARCPSCRPTNSVKALKALHGDQNTKKSLRKLASYTCYSHVKKLSVISETWYSNLEHASGWHCYKFLFSSLTKINNIQTCTNTCIETFCSSPVQIAEYIILF